MVGRLLFATIVDRFDASVVFAGKAFIDRLLFIVIVNGFDTGIVESFLD